jgi:dihydrofolate synthase / folylpolyglutamate synthase
MADLPQLIPVKTAVMMPPKDDLFRLLKDALPPLRDGDVVCITSKVISIHEGRCVKGEVGPLVPQETDWWLPSELNSYGFELTIVHHALIASAGIDRSNSNGYLTLLPKDPTASATYIRQWMMETWGIKQLGVIVTDSHVTPLRWGTSGVAIGARGIKPLRDYRGKPDIFGQAMRVSQSNMIDPLAAAAVNLMGEGSEQIPVVIIRNWPGLVFSEDDIWKDFAIPPEDDLLWPLLKVFETHGHRGAKNTDEKTRGDKK